MRSIKLHKLLDLVGIIPSSNLIDQEINNISFNSKEVQKGTLFLGMPGLNFDGGKFCNTKTNQLKQRDRMKG
jgi:UDP-N-acetylmuramoyl-L-alanyl-D-glutamate--2,6-diaminopimelate ligase